MLIYDVTDKKSFEDLNNWIREINMYSKFVQINSILVIQIQLQIRY